MNKYEIVSNLAKDKTVEKIIYNLVKPKCNGDIQYLDDLSQDIYIQLLEIEDEKFDMLAKNNQIRYYLVGVCRNNIFSKTSPFYYKYKKYDIEYNEKIFTDFSDDD